MSLFVTQLSSVSCSTCLGHVIRMYPLTPKAVPVPYIGLIFSIFTVITLTGIQLWLICPVNVLS